MKKYKLTDETIICIGIKLYRIEALIDFSCVKAGDKGGFVQSEANLSQNGLCWIYNNAKVYDDAKVFGDAEIYDYAKIYDDAKIYCNAKIYGKAEVCGDAEVYDDAEVCGDAKVCGDAEVYDYAKIYDDAKIYCNAKIYGKAEVCGDAEVYDDAEVCGDAKVCGDAEVYGIRDFIVFKNWWSSGRYFTWTRSNNKWRVGCFYGTGEELIKKAYADSEESGREYERVVRYVESILADEENK